MRQFCGNDDMTFKLKHRRRFARNYGLLPPDFVSFSAEILHFTVIQELSTHDVNTSQFSSEQRDAHYTYFELHSQQRQQSAT